MNPIPVAGSSSGSSSGLEDVAAQRGSELSVHEIDALRASVVAKYGNREKAQAFPRTEFVKAIARAANGYGANGYGANALHRGEIQIFADLLLKASGEQRTRNSQGWPIRGVRVDGDTVIVTVKGGNDAARWLCGEILASVQEALCPRCGGAEMVVGLSYGRGPDDYELEYPCPECCPSEGLL